MSSPTNITSYRIAEKFTILNDRLNGLLKRVYFIKQELNSPDRPVFLPGGDKIYDSLTKSICKKFPNNEMKSSSSSMQPLINIHEDILNYLSSYFYTLVDISDMKRSIFDLLETVRKFNLQLDISINFELTKHYLDLVTNYSAIILLLTKISDVRAIMALFNFAYEYKTGEQEKHVVAMAERFSETQADKVLKQLYAEFNPFSRFITSSIRSLSSCFSPRLVRCQNWVEVKFLDILHEPDKLSHTALTDRMCTQLLSVETMERWIILGSFFIHSELNNTELYNVWKAAYKNSYVLVLYRDEIIHFHALSVLFFDTIKSCGKRVTEIKELYQIAASQSPAIHKERRNYLRLTLRQLCQIITDEPGLLGPKSFLVLWALSYATDEVHWLLRHSENVPAKKGGVINLNSKVNVEDFNDALLPELLFYLEDIRRSILQFSQVIVVFYLQILYEYDAPGLKYMLKDVLGRCGPESQVILTAMYQSLVSLENTTDNVDFSALRLDWFRVQFYLSVASSPINLFQHPKLVSHINSTIVHTKMIDYLNETVKECADLSIFCFYDRKFNEFYERNITYSTQHRFAVVFPLICTHYVNALCDACPEETQTIIRRATQNCHRCLKNLSAHICQLVSQTMDAYCSLSAQLMPKESVPLMTQKTSKKKAAKATVSQTKARTNSMITKNNADVKQVPGMESRRKTRENATALDKSLLALTQLCFAINHCRDIIVWDKAFVPREILFQELSDMVNDKLGKSVELSLQTDAKGEEISFVRQPSEMLVMLQQYMSVLMNVDKHANIEIVRIFTDVFLSQSQLRDSFKGNPTIVAIYIKWYMDVLMRFAYKDCFVYSPLLKSFVTMPGEGQQLAFRAEDYADLNELRALVEIIGPYGMRLLTEAVTQEIARIVEEKLKKLVIQNKTTLESLRDSVHEPAKTKKLTGFLAGVDELLNSLKRIGILLAFRDLCREASQDVLSKRVPFLFETVKSLQQDFISKEEIQVLQMQAQQEISQEDRQVIYSKVNEQLIVNDLCLSMGLKCTLDSNLCSAIENRRRLQAAQAANSGVAAVVGSGADQDYKVAYLLFTFVAYALPRLARLDGTFYHVELEAHANNVHCIAYAVNSLMMVLFSRYGHDELDSREKEFMALTSSNLLRLGLEGGLESVEGGPGAGEAPPKEPACPARGRHSLYILFDLMTSLCQCLSADLREACFPYALIRHAYHSVAKMSRATIASLAHPTVAAAVAAHVAAGRLLATAPGDPGSQVSGDPLSMSVGSAGGAHRSSVTIAD